MSKWQYWEELLRFYSKIGENLSDKVNLWTVAKLYQSFPWGKGGNNSEQVGRAFRESKQHKKNVLGHIYTPMYFQALATTHTTMCNKTSTVNSHIKLAKCI